jgi:hypothetical protein
MGHGIDKIALPAIEIDVLDNPNQIQNDTDQDKAENDRADAEQDPINAAVLGRYRDRVEYIEQNPADGQSNHSHNHEDREEDWPFEALAFEHVKSFSCKVDVNQGMDLRLGS